MSFTGTALLAEAYPLANVDERNITGAQRLAFLNKVLRAYYRDIGGVDSSFSLTTVSSPALTASTQEYAIPASDEVSEWRFVGYRLSSSENWMPLQHMPDYMARQYDPLTGQPQGFYTTNSSGVFKVGLVPIPDSNFVTANTTVTFRYRYKPADLTATTDTIYLNQEAKNSLVEALASEFAMIDNNPQLAAMLKMSSQREKSAGAEDSIDQTLAEINLFPHLGHGGIGFPPSDRRFYRL